MALDQIKGSSIAPGSITTVNLVTNAIDANSVIADKSIAMSKLSTGSSGQLIVCDTSGTPSFVSQSGDVTFTTSGLANIATGAITLAKLAQAVQDALPPIGSIIAWLPGYIQTSDSKFRTVAVSLPASGMWKECDGSSHQDDTSVLYAGSGKKLPDLTSNRFLAGATLTDNTTITGGSNTLLDHQHNTTAGGTLTAAGQSYTGSTSPNATGGPTGGSDGPSDNTSDGPSNNTSTGPSGGSDGIGVWQHNHGAYKQGFNMWSYSDAGVWECLVPQDVSQGYGGVHYSGDLNHSHGLGGHTHGLQSHTHTMKSHTHTLGTHTHTSASVTLNHTHGSSSVTGTIGGGSAPGSTDNKPSYLNCKYIIRIK